MNPEWRPLKPRWLPGLGARVGIRPVLTQQYRFVLIAVWLAYFQALCHELSAYSSKDTYRFSKFVPRDKIASLVRGYFLFSEIRVHDEFRFRFGLGTNKLFII